VPYVILGLLVLAVGLGAGLGLSEAPVISSATYPGFPGGIIDGVCNIDEGRFIGSAQGLVPGSSKSSVSLSCSGTPRSFNFTVTFAGTRAATRKVLRCFDSISGWPIAAEAKQCIRGR